MAHRFDLRGFFSNISPATKERLVRWLIFGLAGGSVPLFAKAFGHITTFGDWPSLLVLLENGELVTISIALAFVVMEQVLSSEAKSYRTLRLIMGGVILVFAIACAFVYSSISTSTVVSNNYRIGSSIISFVIVGLLIGPAVILMTGNDLKKKEPKRKRKRKEKNANS